MDLDPVLAHSKMAFEAHEALRATFVCVALHTIMIRDRNVLVMFFDEKFYRTRLW